MGKQQIKKLEALIVSVQPYRENDKLVALFSPPMGMTFAKATSAMELKSHLGMRLLPLSLGSFTLVRTGGSFPILSGVDIVAVFRQWKTPGTRVLTASVILTVLSEIVATQETSYEFYRMSVNLLRSNPKTYPEKALAIFLLRSMHILGVISPAETCFACRKILSSGSVLAPMNLTSFFCVRCFNKIYGTKEVSAVKFSASDLNYLLSLLKIPILNYHSANLTLKQLSLLIELFKARASDMLPRTSALLNEVQAYLKLPLALEGI